MTIVTIGSHEPAAGVTWVISAENVSEVEQEITF